MEYKIYHYDVIDSTNSEAERILKSYTSTDPFVVIADYQTAGRGQGKHLWSSNKSENLTLSVCLFPGIDSSRQFYITAMTSVSIMQTVASFIGDANMVKIKWINDVYVNDDKIAGILISNNVMSEKIKSSIIGIGLNVNQTIFDENIPNPTSLKRHLGNDVQVSDVFEVLMENIRQNYLIMQRTPEALRKMYVDNLYKFNVLHTYTIAGERKAVAIKGVDVYGDIIY